MDMPYLVSSSAEAHVCCSHLLTIMNNATMNTGKVIVWKYIFLFLCVFM